MPLGTNPRFSEVRTFFGGPANLAAYVRGGSYVPNIPANSAISTTVSGLRLSQFSGADKVAAVSLTLPPSLGYSSKGSYVPGIGGWCSIRINSTGYIQYSSYEQNYANNTTWASGATTAYSVRFTILTGTANDFSTGAAFGVWHAINSTNSGPTIITKEWFGTVASRLRVRVEIALTSNTGTVLKTCEVTFMRNYDDGNGGGVLV